VNSKTYLAKWISGEITDYELMNYVSEKDLEDYVLLRNSISSMKSISPDLNLTFELLQQRKSQKTYSVPRMRKRVSIFYTSVALLLLFISVTAYHFGFYGEKNILTNYNEKNLSIGKNVFLVLSQNTSITQRASLYNQHEMQLNYGEVYFEVTKGHDFLIETPVGFVRVLGTKFKVESRKGILDVKCFEGRVKVSCKGSDFFVDAGKEFNSVSQNVKELDDANLSAKEKKSLYHEFNRTSLLVVKTFFEENYNITIELPKGMLQQKFTGTLPKDELQLSLRLIASSFHLKYEIKENRVIFRE
jgi:transmembrane sensor